MLLWGKCKVYSFLYFSSWPSIRWWSYRCIDLHGIRRITNGNFCRFCQPRFVKKVANSPTQKLDKYLAKYTQQRMENMSWNLRNSEHCIIKIRDIKINEGDIVASLHTKSLYPCNRRDIPRRKLSETYNKSRKILYYTHILVTTTRYINK